MEEGREEREGPSGYLGGIPGGRGAYLQMDIVVLFSHWDALILIVGSCWIILYLPALWILFNLGAPIAWQAGWGWG